MTLSASRLPGWLVCLIMPLAGAVAALGLAPYGYWGATLGALALMFWLFRSAQTRRQGALWLWMFATGYFAVALRWLVEPFQVDAATHGWMAPFALAFMAGGLALFWGAAGWLAVWLRSGSRLDGLNLVATLSLAELARAYIFTGFPWAGLAQIWVDTGIAMRLAELGPHGVAFFTLLTCAGISVFNVKHWDFWLFYVLPVFLWFAQFLVSPNNDYITLAPAEARSEHTIRLVQPNAPQHEKWDPEKAPTFFWRQVDATAASPRPDLIVWPETAIPALLHQASEALEIVADAAAGTPVVMGMQRAQDGTYRNSAFVLDAKGEVGQIYDKHHLVPFGEYIPYAPTLRRFGLRAIADQLGQGYTPGAGPQLMDLGALGKALPLICYEAVFPQHARAPGDERPDFILQVTNDAWFGTDSGPQQHLAQARMRAIEQGMPLVRAANTGISALIDVNGHIIASMGLGEHGFIDAPLPNRGRETFYSRTSDWPVVGIVALMLLGRATIKRKTH